MSYYEPGSGFESNGKGYCRKCGLTRVEFGFMPGSCQCTKNTFTVTNPHGQQKIQGKDYHEGERK